jgi:hypothetical protein
MCEMGIHKVQILHAEADKMIETDSLSTTMAVCSLEGWVSTLKDDRKPDDGRQSRPDLGERVGEIPSRHSPQINSGE